MTPQQAYNRIRTYFSRPDAVLARVQRPGGQVCKYRTPTGDKCAVGCLVSDEMYFRLEDRGCSLDDPMYGIGGALISVAEKVQNKLSKGENGDFNKLAGIIGLNDPPLFEFLREAQRAHDDHGTETVPDFLAKLDSIAGERGLAVPA